MSIVVNDGDSAPINVHNVVLKHGSHNQSTHGRGKGGTGGGAGSAEDDGIPKVGDNLDGVTMAEGAKVKVTSGKYAGQNGIIDSSSLDGKKHAVRFKGNDSAVIEGSNMTLRAPLD